MSACRYMVMSGLLVCFLAVPTLSFAGGPGQCVLPEKAADLVVAGREFAMSDSPNYLCAIESFERAAKEGSAEAAFNLGVMYAQSWGMIRPDDRQATHWFTKAAEAGLPDAQYNLGVRYSLGLGVQQDDGRATRWFTEAAEAGLPDAQYNLGVRYLHGRGQLKDYVEAYRWFNLAAASGNVEASAARDLIALEMTPEQIAEAQRLSREWRAEHESG